jgi:Flp pilus assembly protein TadD
VLFFFLCLVPVSHLVPFMVLMAERFLYLPSVAVCLFAGWLFIRNHARYRWAARGTGLLLLCVCAWGTLSRNADWADLDRLWGKTARCAPGFHAPYSLMGTARLRQGRPAEALPLFEKAAGLAPADPQPEYNRGLALQRLGRAEEAERAYRKALSLAPDHTKALNNLGSLLEAKGKLSEAKECYLRAKRGDPSQPAPYVNLGNLLQREGRVEEAESLFRQALRIAPRLT